MRTLIVALTIAALSIGMFATSVRAKGPVQPEVSGGDLKAPIRLDGTIQDGGLFVNGSLDAPLPYPDNIYTIRFMAAAPDGTEWVAWTVTYYPAHAGYPAMFQDDTGIYFPVTGQLQRMLAGAGLLNDHAAASGSSLSLATSALGVAIGVVLLLALGFAGRTVARRSPEPAAAPASNR